MDKIWKSRRYALLLCVIVLMGALVELSSDLLNAQEQPSQPSIAPADIPAPPGSGGFQPPPFGGFGPPPFGGQEKMNILKRFDKNGDGFLNLEERKAAREALSKENAQNQKRRGPRPPFGGGFGQERLQPKPGLKISTNEVKYYPDKPLYASNIVRTFFLQFESDDWEKELEDFHNTDVDVPATLIVDGKTYSNVGVRFRGTSSYMMVGTGYKRSFNLTLDYVKEGQNLYGYRTLNLLNSHGDPSFLRTVLYFDIARNYLPAPKANFIRLVINGECWGIYINQQQFNKDFLKEWFGSSKGARWKAEGRPNARAGLEYIGDDIEQYKKYYTIKSKDDAKAWRDLVNLCKVLNTTPPERLEAELSKILDIDAALKFLALDITLINNDGYWLRSSDYDIYEDPDGKFHIIPYDANEAFSVPGGPGSGKMGGFGQVFSGWGRRNRDRTDTPATTSPNSDYLQGQTPVNLDSLYGLNDSTKPLRSKLLAVPSLKRRYLEYVRDIAEKWLDWKVLGPIAKQYQQLIDEDIKNDTRKLSSYEAFKNAVDGDLSQERSFGPERPITIKQFAEQRRKYLLEHPAIKELGK